MNRILSTFKNVESYVYVMAAFLLALTVACFWGITEMNSDVYLVKINGRQMGYVREKSDAQVALANAKHQINRNNEEMVLVDADLSFEQIDKKMLKIQAKDELANVMYQELYSDDTHKQLAYTVKIDDYTVTLASKDEVIQVLTKAQKKYSHEDNIAVSLVKDSTKETGVLTASVEKATQSKKENTLVASAKTKGSKQANAPKKIEKQAEKKKTTKEKSKKEAIVVDVEFKEDIQVLETYVGDNQVASVNEVVNEITTEEEKNSTYIVKQGETLSEIADDSGMRVNALIKLNPKLKDSTSIESGETLTIKSTAPQLTVLIEKEINYEEIYHAKKVYVDNEDLYEGTKNVIQKAQKGKKSITASVKYSNGLESGREIIEEEIVEKAIPTVIERGTKERPTFIKPISGGILTSGYGPRWGRTHKGTDWACPVGTSVKASADGTIVGAGWVNGYGNCITILHDNGKQTRYAHLSEILVSEGQNVAQGDEIALSGNTGRSTGPHIHFEIINDGIQENPFTYFD